MPARAAGLLPAPLPANCGAPPLQAFLTVTLPAVMPGVITDALLMFVLAFNEIIVSLLLTDARTVTLPILIYNSIRSHHHAGPGRRVGGLVGLGVFLESR